MYIQTESSGYAFLQPNENISSNSVGTAGPEVEFKVDQKGEIIYRSPGNFMGYYKNDKETKKDFRQRRLDKERRFWDNQ
jgi:long-chain acyl-CoA synthetase